MPTPPGEWWRYRLEAAAPPWWVPLLPEHIDRDASSADPADPAVLSVAQVRLRRARVQSWGLLGAGQAGPKSELLDPTRPRWLDEEQVPKAGVTVERAWQLARWHDGSLHVWLRYRVTPRTRRELQRRALGSPRSRVRGGPACRLEAVCVPLAVRASRRTVT